VQTFLGYTFSGLATTAIYGVAAAGLVLTYTTTGTFNFAHGATGMIAAFTYWQLRFAWNWPAPLALAVCLLILAPLVGVVEELAIFRRLRGTAEYTRLVVTIGVLVGLLGAALWIWDPNTAHPIRAFYDGRVVTIAGVRVTYHEIASILIAVIVVIGLRLFLYRTRIGVAMRGSVDDRSLAMLNGARPDRASLLAWAIGASLAALSGILISPTVTLSALPLTLLIVNAYAAAMIGRLRSLPWTFVGAFILGMADSYSRGYMSTHLPDSVRQYLDGFYVSIPVIVLFIVLLVLPNPRLRGRASNRVREVIPMPTWMGTAMFGVAVIGGSAMMTQIITGPDLESISRLWGIAIIGLSFVPLIGYAGQVSLCQFSFAAIGAIVVAHLGGSGNPLALVWVALITGAVGAIIALPALRLSGIYLALSTAAFAVAMDLWIFQLPEFSVFGHHFEIFQGGSLTIGRLRFLGMNFDGQKSYFLLMSVAFVLMSLVVVAVRRSMFGYRLLAMKDSPAACATLGLNLTRTKLAVFTLSAAMAGIGGALYAGALRVTDATAFQFFSGLSLLLVMVVAGIATIGGALACGIAIGAPLLANLFPHLPELPLVLFGTAGIGLGRNTNGFVVDLRERFADLAKRPGLIVATGAVLVGVWLLRIAKVMTNWPYAIVSVTIILLSSQLPWAIAFWKARATGESVPSPLALVRTNGNGAKKATAAGPLEWVGITEPFTPELAAGLDRALGLPDAARS
jgi:branched-chain amino acid transport system permease protein